jgi:DNA-binding MarR family transcriptional regulator
VSKPSARMVAVQDQLLAALRDQRDKTTPQLEREIGGTDTYRALRQLEKRGLVEGFAQQDNRAVLWRLTKAGRKLVVKESDIKVKS